MKYWIVRSMSQQEPKEEGVFYLHREGEYVIEAATGEEAVEIAKEFLIGQMPRVHYTPKYWRLIGKCYPEQVMWRAEGRGGRVHYRTENGTHGVRKPEEIEFDDQESEN